MSSLKEECDSDCQADFMQMGFNISLFSKILNSKFILGFPKDFFVTLFQMFLGQLHYEYEEISGSDSFFKRRGV